MEVSGGFLRPSTGAIEHLFHDSQLLIKRNETHYIASFTSGVNWLFIHYYRAVIYLLPVTLFYLNLYLLL